MRPSVVTILVVIAGLSLFPFLPVQGDDVEASYHDAKKTLNAGEYSKAIRQYQSLREKYPNSPHAIQAELEIAFAFHRMGESTAALDVLKNFIKKNPDHLHKDYAYYLAGLTLYDDALKLSQNRKKPSRGRTQATVIEEALDYFNLLIEQYPNGTYTQDARVKTRQLLALPRETGAPEQAGPTPDRDGDWLMEQPGDHYTLQLLTRNSEAEIKEIIEAEQLTDKAIIYATDTPRGSRYTLLYGIYPSREEAMEQGATFPKTLVVKSEPWVKKLNLVQAEIHQDRLRNTLGEQGRIALGEEEETDIPNGAEDEEANDITALLAPPPHPAIPAEVAEVAEPAAAKEEAKEEEVESVAQQATEKAKAPAPSPAPEAKQAQTKKGGFYELHPPSDNWVLSQDPNDYTVQLAAMHKTDWLEMFFKDHKLNGRAVYIRGHYHDKEWFPVLYGSYPTLKEANSAAERIQRELGLNNVWVRRFKGLQAQLKQ